MKRAQLLEDICRRNLCMPQAAPRRISEESAQALLAAVRLEVPDAEVSGGDYAVLWADRGEALRAQLDDMAQMLGPRVLCVEPAAEDVVRPLKSGTRCSSGAWAPSYRQRTRTTGRPFVC